MWSDAFHFASDASVLYFVDLSAIIPRFLPSNGPTAPYCLLLRLESPCRLGQRDLAIETASN
jgi:hypothetical protein